MAMADTYLSSSPVYSSLQILLQTGQSIQGFWSFGFPTNAKNALFKGIQASFSSSALQEGEISGKCCQRST